MRVEFYGLKFDLPNNWKDITDDLPDGSPPSLARPSGAGALQFSVVKYRGGEEPNVKIGDLRKFLEEFCDCHGMSRADIVDCSQKLMSVKVETCVDGELIIARYFSNGRDVLLATYVCQDLDNPEMDEDLKGVGHIMNSMEL